MLGLLWNPVISFYLCLWLAGRPPGCGSGWSEVCGRRGVAPELGEYPRACHPCQSNDCWQSTHTLVIACHHDSYGFIKFYSAFIFFFQQRKLSQMTRTNWGYLKCFLHLVWFGSVCEVTAMEFRHGPKWLVQVRSWEVVSFWLRVHRTQDDCTVKVCKYARTTQVEPGLIQEAGGKPNTVYIVGL